MRTPTQVKREAARIAVGLCCWCGEPRGKSRRYCDRHVLIVRREHRNRKGCAAWQPGGRGRKPMEVKK